MGLTLTISLLGLQKSENQIVNLNLIIRASLRAPHKCEVCAVCLSFVRM